MKQCKCKDCGNVFGLDKILKTKYYTTERDIRSQGQDYGTYTEEHVMHICPKCGSSNTNYSDILEKAKEDSARRQEVNKAKRENTKAIHKFLGQELDLGTLVEMLNVSSVNGYDYDEVTFTVNGKKMLPADVDAVFKNKKNIVINFTCDENDVAESEKSFFNKFTKDELIRKMFGKDAYTNYCGKISSKLQGVYADMTKNTKETIVSTFVKLKRNEINKNEAKKMLAK